MGSGVPISLVYEGVLVHCLVGVSRSSSLVISYLMRAHGWTYDEARPMKSESRGPAKASPGARELVATRRVSAGTPRSVDLGTARREWRLPAPAISVRPPGFGARVETRRRSPPKSRLRDAVRRRKCSGWTSVAWVSQLNGHRHSSQWAANLFDYKLIYYE